MNIAENIADDKDLHDITKKALSGLSEDDISTVIQDLYRLQLYRYTLDDVYSQMEEDERFSDISEDDFDCIAENCARRYTYEGDYDCNLSYWDNIQGLINEESEHYLEDGRGNV